MAAMETVQRVTSAARRSRAAPYIWLAGSVGGLALVSQNFGDTILRNLGELSDSPTAPVLGAVVLFGLCSFASFYATWRTPLPSFVVSIALGLAGHTLFAPIVGKPTLLASLVTGSAAIILFGGGLEMPLRSFVRLFVKIALLAIPGVVITGFAFSQVVGRTSGLLGYHVAGAAVILLGAILASTDPAAIIPVLEHVRFKRRDAKDIVIAESALNDVVGTLLASAFFKLPLATVAMAAAYTGLASASTFGFLATQTVFGTVFGLLGFGLLWLLSQMIKRHNTHFGADQVYFLATPILAFVGASALGGSGFLAAFVAGLLFHAEEHMAGVERFFFQVIDGVAKPVIFILLGALVNLQSLIAYAPIGIATALVFMFAVRPAMVFLMIGPFGLVRGARGLHLRELLFISFVRETGAIPAVLLVTAVSRVSAPVNGLVESGMWVILLTLVLAPPFTPLVARRLGLAE